MSEHSEHEHPEHHHEPDPERRRWTMEAIVALFAFMFSVALAGISLAGVGYLAVYRIGDLESWKKDHIADQRNASEKLDARISKIEEKAAATEGAVDHRLTTVETTLGAILDRLTSIDRKLDAQPDGRHR